MIGAVRADRWHKGKDGVRSLSRTFALHGRARYHSPVSGPPVPPVIKAAVPIFAVIAIRICTVIIPPIPPLLRRNPCSRVAEVVVTQEKRRGVAVVLLVYHPLRKAHIPECAFDWIELSRGGVMGDMCFGFGARAFRRQAWGFRASSVGALRVVPVQPSCLLVQPSCCPSSDGILPVSVL